MANFGWSYPPGVTEADLPDNAAWDDTEDTERGKLYGSLRESHSLSELKSDLGLGPELKSWSGVEEELDDWDVDEIRDQLGV